ncbi:HAD family phosphatase [Cellulomonas sp. C5510]|uniref:HAD family hydrolase n=1 Tax=Cellulomonas sp. C5510 TaxID=2871170 RepID=UPI001C98B5DE|nr:HAD-IA family hydrolase [Cellulomonas sp. C5510]QZN85098.1 HAD-IA family hydrolase [Cellulomonas sp. C5510]
MTTPTGPASPPASDGRRDVLAEVFDAVLLDMDGTLISSTRSVERCWLRLAQEFGMPTDDLSPFGFHGVPARDIVDLLLPDAPAEVRAAALDRVVELEVADTEGIEELPGAADVLGLLGAAGRTALVTSCGRRLAAARVGAVGLAVPSAVVTADDVARGKPDPEPYLAGAALLGADPRRCLVVEDAASGVRSGRAAGAATLGLRTTEPEGPAGADLVVADLAAVRFTVEEDGVRVHLR